MAFWDLVLREHAKFLKKIFLMMHYQYFLKIFMNKKKNIPYGYGK